MKLIQISNAAMIRLNNFCSNCLYQDKYDVVECRHELRLRTNSDGKSCIFFKNKTYFLDTLNAD